jgi:hypothetical protein
MFTEASSWLSHSPRLRRRVMKLWRALLRLQRASLARAVLVARRDDDCVLVGYSGTGEMRLPSLDLDGWQAVGTQVQEWLDQISRKGSTLQLKAIDGTPGHEGVTFLYAAEVNGLQPGAGYTWLEPELAPSALSPRDRRLLSSVSRSLR